MIRSILDTDLYKFTTSYAYFKLYPEAIGTFTFNDRAKTEFDEDFLEKLRELNLPAVGVGTGYDSIDCVYPDIAKGVRLHICNHGAECLIIFCISAVLSAVYHIIMFTWTRWFR